MSRPGTVNFRITDLRRRWFEKLAQALDLDPERHRHLVEMLDYSLKLAAMITSAGEEQEENDDLGKSEDS